MNVIYVLKNPQNFIIFLMIANTPAYKLHENYKSELKDIAVIYILFYFI